MPTLTRWPDHDLARVLLDDRHLECLIAVDLVVAFIAFPVESNLVDTHHRGPAPLRHLLHDLTHRVLAIWAIVTNRVVLGLGVRLTRFEVRCVHIARILEIPSRRPLEVDPLPRLQSVDADGFLTCQCQRQPDIGVTQQRHAARTTNPPHRRAGPSQGTPVPCPDQLPRRTAPAEAALAVRWRLHAPARTNLA